MQSKLHLLVEFGKELAKQRDYPTLFKHVVTEVCQSFEAEGATFYLYDESDHKLKAVVAKNSVTNIDHTLRQFDPLHIEGLFAVDLEKSDYKEKSISGECYQKKRPVIILDLENDSVFDHSGIESFDNKYKYKTISIAALPLFNSLGNVLGVLQLVNSKQDLKDKDNIELIETLASFIGVAVENSLLLISTQNLLTSVVEMISSTIDQRSKVTGGHSFRVTELTMMIAQEMMDDKEGRYKDFDLTQEEYDELKTAALLHDVGKLATPDYVLEKVTKLEQISDRIDVLKMRFEIRKLELRNKQLEQALDAKGIEVPKISDEIIKEVDEEFNFIKTLNIGGEFLDKDKLARLEVIAKKSCLDTDLIQQHDLENLSVARGTLNPTERKIMENHAAISIQLLNQLPWPKNLANVPEIAGKHHENIDGSGYPNGVYGVQMSTCAKILSIADRFEGLSSPDRRYRLPKSLAEVMKIMQYMSNDNHIDSEMYEFFVEKNIHLTYAREYLDHKQIDQN